jgi:hypothetical protein
MTPWYRGVMTQRPDREPGRCQSLVERNGYYTGRRCSRQAVTGGYCAQHATKRGLTIPPFIVRGQSSGYGVFEKYIVVKRDGGRVTTWPHSTREAAQAEADELNIGAMVKDFADDPRPYRTRLDEAERQYWGQS